MWNIRDRWNPNTPEVRSTWFVHSVFSWLRTVFTIVVLEFFSMCCNSCFGLQKKVLNEKIVDHWPFLTGLRMAMISEDPLARLPLIFIIILIFHLADLHFGPLYFYCTLFFLIYISLRWNWICSINWPLSSSLFFLVQPGVNLRLPSLQSFFPSWKESKDWVIRERKVWLFVSLCVLSAHMQMCLIWKCIWVWQEEHTHANTQSLSKTELQVDTTVDQLWMVHKSVCVWIVNTWRDLLYHMWTRCCSPASIQISIWHIFSHSLDLPSYSLFHIMVERF